MKVTGGSVQFPDKRLPVDVDRHLSGQFAEIALGIFELARSCDMA